MIRSDVHYRITYEPEPGSPRPIIVSDCYAVFALISYKSGFKIAKIERKFSFEKRWQRHPMDSIG